MSELPRVSDVLKILYPNSLDHVPQEALERGTRLHTYMECWANNRIYGYEGENFIPEECRPAVDWLIKNELELQATEEHCVSKLGYCGHPDLLAKWKGVDYWIDYKFSQAITEQNLMQGAAYCDLTGRKGLFLRCGKDGSVNPVKCKSDPTLWVAFLSGLNVAKFHRRG